MATKNVLQVAIPSEYLYRKPSSNEKISYTLVSLINHDVDLLDCGHYVSDVFDSSLGIWWHCDDDNITEISDLPKGVYYRETHKHTKNKNKSCQDQQMYYLLFFIRTSHLTKHSYNFFKKSQRCPKSLI